FMGDRTFAAVYMNGIVRDPQHRAFSKSLGNGIDPLDVVAQYGADALRFTIVAGAAAGTDVIMDRNDLDATFAAGRNFANKLWNVGRLILSHLPEAPTPLAEHDRAAFTLGDRWILARCQRVVRETTAALDRMRLNDAANTVYHFVWDELADWYLEHVKPRLYGAAPGGDVARSILVDVFGTALQLLHPVMPFITEELWGHLPAEHSPLLAGARWPEADPTYDDEEAETAFGLVQGLVGAVRTIRAEYRVPPAATLTAMAAPAGAAAARAFAAERETILRLAKLEALETAGDAEGIGGHAVLADGTAVFVPLGEAIDVERECTRLRDEHDRIEGLLAGVHRKLANENFVTRAPAEVVERERDKERSWREQQDTLAAKLRALGC
ncbi:MAG: class I tRNA ligase family protein, partial [Gemmatimonadota bacterium]